MAPVSPPSIPPPPESNTPLPVMSQAEVKKALEAEEDAALKGGASALHKTSPSGFVEMGLEIEDTQCVEFSLNAEFWFAD